MEGSTQMAKVSQSYTQLKIECFNKKCQATLLIDVSTNPTYDFILKRMPLKIL